MQWSKLIYWKQDLLILRFLTHVLYNFPVFLNRSVSFISGPLCLSIRYYCTFFCPILPSSITNRFHMLPPVTALACHWMWTILQTNHTLSGTHVTFWGHNDLYLNRVNTSEYLRVNTHHYMTTLTPWWSGSVRILDYCEGLMICGWQIMCVSVYTRRKSLSYSLPRRRAASPRILIQHASPEDDRYPSVERPQLRPLRAWLMPSNLIPPRSISKKDPKVFEGLSLKENGASHWSSNDELVSNWVNGLRQMSNSSCL